MATVTTDFFTHCWKNALTAGLLAAALALGLPVPARAEARVDLTELQVEHADDGLYLSARLRLDLPAVVEDALYKGIAIQFVAEAEVLRERWYWYDRQMASARRHMRLAYQPLTRRWRLNTSPEPIVNPSLGVAFTQHYDTLAEALAAVRRISGWRIATPAELEGGGRQTMRFQFRLDASQLPRAFQIGAIGDADWALAIERRIDLTQEAAR
jgi:hypothetical protein